MVMVPTVRGEVDSTTLGTTLMHEHVFVLTTDVQQNYPDEWGTRRKRVADAVARLTELKGLGVDTIVDPTVVGLGPVSSPASSASTSRSTSTSWSPPVSTPTRSVPNFFRFRGPAPRSVSWPDPMVDLFVRDLTVGIAGTGVRAGAAQVRHRPRGHERRGWSGLGRSGWPTCRPAPR